MHARLADLLWCKPGLVKHNRRLRLEPPYPPAINIFPQVTIKVALLQIHCCPAAKSFRTQLESRFWCGLLHIADYRRVGDANESTLFLRRDAKLLPFRYLVAPNVLIMAATTLDLTTVFTPPTSCLQSVFTLSPSGSDVYESGTVTRGIASQCYPSGFRSVYENGSIFGNTFVFVNGGSSSEGVESTTYQSFYSPGVCPSGYSTDTARFSAQTFFATCCPSGYTLGPTGSNTNHEACTHTILGDYMTLIADGTSNTTIPYPGTAVAPAVKIAYMESDQANMVTGTNEPSSTSATSSSAASPAATSDNTAPTAPVSTDDTAFSDADRGLSTGAQAGIGVGVALAVMLAAGIIFFYLRSRRRKQRDRTQQTEGPQFEKAELPGSPSRRHADAELAADDAALNEASDEAAKPPEMDSMNVRAELPGDWEGAQAPGREESRDHRHEAPA